MTPGQRRQVRMRAAKLRGGQARSAALKARRDAEARGATPEEIREVTSQASAQVMKMPLELFYARALGASAA
jgi:hypothetical protein